jgi:hydrogen peroxide-dependent heme synthase
MNSAPYTYYSAFKARIVDRAVDVAGLAQQVDALATRHSIHIRGIYASLGFRTDSDLAMWWIADSAEALQAMLAGVRRAELGALVDQTWGLMGVHRPPEVAKDHLPAFMRGDSPKNYVVIYPFVRTAEWYLMPRDQRAALLREHGELGRQYPTVLANTTSGFGLGDWEWILAFEAENLRDLVDCMRRLRDAEARRYAKEDIPFITGIRADAKDVFALLW